MLNAAINAPQHASLKPPLVPFHSIGIAIRTNPDAYQIVRYGNFVLPGRPHEERTFSPNELIPFVNKMASISNSQLVRLEFFKAHLSIPIDFPGIDRTATTKPSRMQWILTESAFRDIAKWIQVLGPRQKDS
jgi:hypothetical protein